MNTTTGEIRETTKERPVGVDEVGISIGGVIEINGVPCRLVAVNAGKRRLTFQTMPRSLADAQRSIAEAIEAVSVDQIRRKVQVGQ